MMTQNRTGRGFDPITLDKLDAEFELVDVVNNPQRPVLYAAKAVDGRWEAGAATLKIVRASKPDERPKLYAVELHRDIVLRSSETAVAKRPSAKGEIRDHAKITEAPEAWEQILLVIKDKDETVAEIMDVLALAFGGSVQATPEATDQAPDEPELPAEAEPAEAASDPLPPAEPSATE